MEHCLLAPPELLALHGCSRMDSRYPYSVNPESLSARLKFAFAAQTLETKHARLALSAQPHVRFGWTSTQARSC